jgi:hypothetical protein
MTGQRDRPADELDGMPTPVPRASASLVKGGVYREPVAAA